LARLAGAPVFGDGSGAAEATAAACAEEHGAFGFVAVDLEEQEEEGEGEGVVGVVVGQREAAATVVLLTLAIRADRRRQGIGRALVDALATRAKEQEGAKAVVADVARDNAPALAALAAAGFCFDGGGGKKSKVLEGVLEL
jgi:ribosomal-protein-alanine N-acetyltransferase